VTAQGSGSLEGVPRHMLPPSLRPPSLRPQGRDVVAAQRSAAAASTAAAAAQSTAAAPAQHGSGIPFFRPNNGGAAAAGAVTAAPGQSPSISLRRVVNAADELADALLSETTLVQPANPRSAHVVVLGTPNAGKSTLVNRLVRSKISAVSHKRNTTRTSVLGVATKDNRQLVLFDTPGVLPKLLSNKYQKELSTAAWDAALGADVAVLIVDAVKRLGPAELELLEKARLLAESSAAAEGGDGAPKMKLVLLINKMDLCKPASRARQLAEHLRGLAPFAHTLFVSVLRDKGVAELEDLLYSSCVPRDWEYASTSVTDQSPSERVVEIVREKIFARVHQEIPYRVNITNRGWTELHDGSLRIDLDLKVDTHHQRLILAGRGDQTLQHIKQRALPEIEQMLQRKVHLFLKCSSKD